MHPSCCPPVVLGRRIEKLWIGGDRALQKADGAQWGASGVWRSGLLDLDGCLPEERAAAAYGAIRAPHGAHLTIIPSWGLAGETCDRAILAVHVTRLHSLDTLGALAPTPPATTYVAGADDGLITLTATSPWRQVTQVNPMGVLQALAVTADPGSGLITVRLATDGAGYLISTLADVVAIINTLTASTTVVASTVAPTQVAVAITSGYIAVTGYTVTPGSPLVSPHAAVGLVGDPAPTNRIAQALLTHTHYLGDLGPELMRHGVAGLDLATLAGGARYVQVALQWLWPWAVDRDAGQIQHYWTTTTWPMQVTLADGPGRHSRVAERRAFQSCPLTAAASVAALVHETTLHRVAVFVAPGGASGASVRVERFAVAATAGAAYTGSAAADARVLFIAPRAAGPGGMGAPESLSAGELNASDATFVAHFAGMAPESIEVWAGIKTGTLGARLPYAVSVTWHGGHYPQAAGGGGQIQGGGK
jgi:hypothetical protein